MRIIKIKNPKVLENPYTYVSERYTSGASLSVEDSSGFADNDLVLIGGVGNEKAEVTDLTSAPPNKTSLAISALDFTHETDESVQKVFWDKYYVDYRTSSTGTWTNVISQADFDWKDSTTTYIHSSGADAYEYRVKYYNSATAVSSGWSDTSSGAGYSRLQVGELLRKTRKMGKDEAAVVVSDDEIIGYFNSVNDIVKAMNRRWWFLRTEYEFVTAADTRGYSLPSDCERVYRLKYRFADGVDDIEYYLRFLPKVEFEYEYRDQGADSDDNLVHYTVDWENSQVLIGPPPETASYTLTLVYAKSITDVDSYADTVAVPFPDLYVNYAVAQIWKFRENEEKGAYYMAEFANAIKLLEQMRVKDYSPRRIKVWKGRSAMRRIYGDRAVYSDTYKDYY